MLSLIERSFNDMVEFDAIEDPALYSTQTPRSEMSTHRSHESVHEVHDEHAPDFLQDAHSNWARPTGPLAAIGEYATPRSQDDTSQSDKRAIVPLTPMSGNNREAMTARSRHTGGALSSASMRRLPSALNPLRAAATKEVNTTHEWVDKHLESLGWQPSVLGHGGVAQGSWVDLSAYIPEGDEEPPALFDNHPIVTPDQLGLPNREATPGATGSHSRSQARLTTPLARPLSRQSMRSHGASSPALLGRPGTSGSARSNLSRPASRLGAFSGANALANPSAPDVLGVLQQYPHNATALTPAHEAAGVSSSAIVSMALGNTVLARLERNLRTFPGLTGAIPLVSKVAAVYQAAIDEVSCTAKCIESEQCTNDISFCHAVWWFNCRQYAKYTNTSDIAYHHPHLPAVRPNFLYPCVCVCVYNRCTLCVQSRESCLQRCGMAKSTSC